VSAVDLAARYAAGLLNDLGCSGISMAMPEPLPLHPAQHWAQSGLMALTGHAAGQPQLCPVPLIECADGALRALNSLLPQADLATLSGAGLLTERAALNGYSRNGRIAPGGSCRLIEALNGRLAVNLAREDDWAAVPAWLEQHIEPDDWSGVERVIADHDCGQLLERARLLGLAVGEDRWPDAPEPWFKFKPSQQAAAFVQSKPPLVLDLSALWAGPLCGDLLRRCGARVIKVESGQRPDGARLGNADFYDLMNAGKESLVLDLSTPAGCEQLRQIISQVDIVIEASRPRGLRQLGIVAEELFGENPQLIWLSLTAYGRGDDVAQWIGYGDDVAVAAGLSSVMRAASGESLIVGDAIADPLTGLHAALAVWSLWTRGQGGLLSVPMVDVVRHCLGFGLPRAVWSDPSELVRRQADWLARITAVQLPRSRRSSTAAADLGEQTQSIIKEFELREHME